MQCFNGGFGSGAGRECPVEAHVLETALHVLKGLFADDDMRYNDDYVQTVEKGFEEYPDADVLMALNDPSVFGGLAAIQGAGASERFLTYSVDGSPEGKAMVSSGFLTATCAQFPSRVAEEAVKQAYAAINGGCERNEVIVPVELLTEENVDQYGIDGWQ